MNAAFRHSRDQVGQALAEFLVLVLALLPLFLLMPVVAKLQDVSLVAQLASRYAAFDAMGRLGGPQGEKTSAVLADEVRRRFFSASRVPVKTGDVSGDFAIERNPFWVGPLGEPLIASFSDVKVRMQGRPGSDRVPFAFPAGVMGLSSGIRVGAVDVGLARLPAGLAFYAPFDAVNLSLSRHTAVLLDSWAATGPAQVQERLDHALIFPGLALAPLSTLLDPIMLLVEPGVSPPRLGKLDFWEDLVPVDRLGTP